ncbi:TetR/AcrR family transcriptional regulator [Leifsonia sp. NPDC058194]|uniref:TetR/AcrR family transcriptional regulator n=1 Tax=Leifsonia sp. NPDC058194 TaxID=3346374 RepID=UPI0036D85F26
MTGKSRRRGPALEAAIYAAIQNQLAEVGYAGLSFEGVAAEAGTSKGVLYRRWSTKAQMVVAATANAADETPIIISDTGSLRGDLLALLGAVQSLFSTQDRETVLSLLAQLGSPEMADLHRSLLTRNTEVIMQIIDRARERGELGNGTPHTSVLSLPFDVVRHDHFILGQMPDAAFADFLDYCYIPALEHATGRDAGA